jgi:hypothetical protein
VLDHEPSWTDGKCEPGTGAEIFEFVHLRGVCYPKDSIGAVYNKKVLADIFGKRGHPLRAL